MSLFDVSLKGVCSLTREIINNYEIGVFSSVSHS